MEQTILTPAQRIVLALVAKEQRLASFYLTGGTALAEFYLRHRTSDDLDFFTQETPDSLFHHEFAERIKKELGAKSMRYERLYDRNQYFFQLPNEELKVEFTRYPFQQLEPPAKRDDVLVDGVRDIAANKLVTLLDRFDPKDFVDLYFLFQTMDLTSIRKDAETKFAMKIGDIFLGSEFAKVRRIQTLPKMLKSLSVEELKAFFSDKAKELSPNVLL